MLAEQIEHEGLQRSQSGSLVLVVDDEEGIRRSLDGVLHDAGFETVGAADGNAALRCIAEKQPALVLLDIWMPGIDGIEILKKIKAEYPQIPVIMISGHAAIATAMNAIKLGAADFIEKPLDLVAIVSAVRRALGLEQGDEHPPRANVGSPGETTLSVGGWSQQLSALTPVFENQLWRGKKIPQRTIARSAILYGQGLHSGKKSGLILEPLPANSGIQFLAVSDSDPVPAHVNHVVSTGFATTLKSKRAQFGTIEHLMSALHAFGISNLLIKCDGEVPVFDGSARDFCSLLLETGLEEQAGEWYAIRVPKLVRVGDEREYIQIEPADNFTIDYTLEYPAPLGLQHFQFTLKNSEHYSQAIAPCRTFGFVKDINYLQKQGYALGGRFDNFVLFGDEGPINDKLRFPDEPVRHKILDAIGDLYLLGRPFEGKVTARMTGHSDNIELLRELQREMGIERAVPAR